MKYGGWVEFWAAGFAAFAGGYFDEHGLIFNKELFTKIRLERKEENVMTLFGPDDDETVTMKDTPRVDVTNFAGGIIFVLRNVGVKLDDTDKRWRGRKTS